MTDTPGLLKTVFPANNGVPWNISKVAHCSLLEGQAQYLESSQTLFLHAATFLSRAKISAINLDLIVAGT